MLQAAFLFALGLGTLLQVAMVVAGHWIDWIAQNLFAFGGLLISLVAGIVYARGAGLGRPAVLVWSAVVGGLCALIGIAVSVAMGDTEPMILAVGTAGSAVTGLLGGLIGRVLQKKGA